MVDYLANYEISAVSKFNELSVPTKAPPFLAKPQYWNPNSIAII